MNTDELLQAVRNCPNLAGCKKCRYYGYADCITAVLRDVRDFIVYHEALLKEAERKAKEDRRH